MENQDNCKVYGYRWVVLVLYVVVSVMTQILWSTFFSITTAAWQYYGFKNAADGENAISLLSLIFMVGMILISFPSLAAFERFGFKKSVGFGAVINGIAAMTRGIFGSSYMVVLICSVFFAVAQPFILNAVGMVAGKWFPENERATANGIGVLSIYFGIMVGLVLTPMLYANGVSIKEILLIYGIAALFISVLFLIFAKEAPPTPPCNLEQSQRFGFIEGMKSLFTKKDFILGSLSFFCILGVFNTFFTLIEVIIKQLSNGKISSTETGVIGVVVLLAGILGSLVIPIVSDRDKFRRRKIYILACNIIGVIGFGYFLFAKNFFEMIFAAVIYGFFVVGSSPVLLTYCAEIAYPTSEGTSEGLLMFIGNVGGAVFLAGSSLFEGNNIITMIVMTGILLACILPMFIMKERKGRLVTGNEDVL